MDTGLKFGDMVSFSTVDGRKNVLGAFIENRGGVSKLLAIDYDADRPGFEYTDQLYKQDGEFSSRLRQAVDDLAVFFHMTGNPAADNWTPKYAQMVSED